MSITSPLRLDNAANIYPASLSKRYSSLYRMSVTLDKPVDAAILQEALVTVSHRIPTFRCGLSSGTFWWYLAPLEKDPTLTPLAPLRTFRFEDYDGHLFRVSADGNRIVLDVFHALTDGNGGHVFLLTLAGEYLRLKEGISIAYNGKVLDPRDPSSASEMDDAFKTVFTGQKGSLEKNDKAYHITGKIFPDSGLKDLRVILPAEKINEISREKGVTVTEFLTAALLVALQDEYRTDFSKKKRSVLKVTVPVDLRPIYGAATLRNFSTYMNLGIDVAEGYKTFDELLDCVKKQKKEALKKEFLEPKIAANVKLEENFVVGCIPLKIKRIIIDFICRMHGDKFCSYTLSNLGRILLPASMRPFITDIDFVLGRQRGNSGAASCVTYGDKLYLHLSRKIYRDDFERYFIRTLSNLGLDLEQSTSSLA